MAIDSETIFRAEKTIPFPVDWFVQDSEDLSFVCPIDVDGVTVASVQLRGAAKLRYPDRNVILQLEHSPFRESGGAICRFEWRPFSGHMNKGLGPSELRFVEIQGSHLHPFDMNWEHCEHAVRRGQLPIAIRIQPDPPNYREFLALVGQEFRITNIQCVSIPPWEAVIL